MKAITLHQPFATCIAQGFKQIETRSWGTSYRGLLAIHAAKQLNPEYEFLNYQPDWQAMYCNYTTLEELYLGSKKFPLGQVVAVGVLISCLKVDDSLYVSQSERMLGDFTPGRYAWYLKPVWALEKPEICAGHQRLWDWVPNPETQAWLRKVYGSHQLSLNL